MQGTAPPHQASEAQVPEVSGFSDLSSWELMLEIVKHMDPKAKSTWRLTHKAANQAVYDGTRALSPSPSRKASAALPLQLCGKCVHLRRVSTQGLKPLKDVTGLPPGLQELDISNTAISDFSSLGQYTALTQLAAAGTMIHSPKVPSTTQMVGYWTQMAAALPHLTRLQRLDLSDNGIGSMGADLLKKLVPALQQLTGLQQLDLSRNRLRIGRSSALVPALLQLTALQQLDLSRNDLCAGGVRALVPALQQLTALKQLDLSHNDLCAGGVDALVPALQQLTELQQLNLSQNDLRVRGFRALVPALQQLTGLQQLDLSRNGLCAEGFFALVPDLHQLTGPKQLDLSDTCITPQDEGDVSFATQHLPRLRKLGIRLETIAPEGPSGGEMRRHRIGAPGYGRSIWDSNLT